MQIHKQFKNDKMKAETLKQIADLVRLNTEYERAINDLGMMVGEAEKTGTTHEFIEYSFSKNTLFYVVYKGLKDYAGVIHEAYKLKENK